VADDFEHRLEPVDLDWDGRVDAEVGEEVVGVGTLGRAGGEADERLVAQRVGGDSVGAQARVVGGGVDAGDNSPSQGSGC
jgi:hypothetical protein